MTALAWVIGIGVGLFLLFRFPRQVGIAALVLVGTGAAIWAYFASQQAAADHIKSLLTMSATADKALCSDPKWPISVNFFNGTGRTVNDVSFWLEGRLPGHSSTTVSDYLSSDVILKPGYHYQNCWRPTTYGAPMDYSSLNWTVRVSSLTTD